MPERAETPLLSGIQTVKSIRDTGYKSTDYAIAELIDNAVDAKARNVTVAIVERSQAGAHRQTYRVSEIMVIDDGHGMDEACSNLALSFGGAGDYNSRTKIGRFGMGLPQASVSQCRLTEVWSWQKSQPEHAHRTCLDLDAIEKGTKTELTVPWPTSPGNAKHEPTPSWGCKLFRELHRSEMVAGQPMSSGTIVRWSMLDRLRWVKATSVLWHTEFLLGRIYRRFIANGDLQINIIIANDEGEGDLSVTNHQKVRANDPMYLMRPEDTVLEYWEKADPEADDPADRSSWLKIVDEPPFMPVYTERKPYTINRPDGNGQAEVIVRFSEVKPVARPGEKAGSFTNLGKQAKENRGVSMIRAGRELLLEKTLVTEPVDRWWGVEVEFSPHLDEVFGVTNNKQDTPYFTTALRYVMDYELPPDAAQAEGLFDEDDPVAALYRIAHDVLKIRGRLKTSASNAMSQQKKNTAKPAPIAQFASNVNRKFANVKPTPGEQERQEKNISDEQVANDIEANLAKQGIPEEEARVVANHYRQGVSVHFLEAGQSQSPAFFWPNAVWDDEQIYINNQHQAYEYLIRPLRLSSQDIEDLSEGEAKRLLGLASDSMALLLQAFVRLELEVQSHPTMANHYQTVREQWGRRLREIVSEPEFLSDVFGEFSDDE